MDDEKDKSMLAAGDYASGAAARGAHGGGDVAVRGGVELKLADTSPHVESSVSPPGSPVSSPGEGFGAADGRGAPLQAAAGRVERSAAAAAEVAAAASPAPAAPPAAESEFPGFQRAVFEFMAEMRDQRREDERRWGELAAEVDSLQVARRRSAVSPAPPSADAAPMAPSGAGDLHADRLLAGSKVQRQLQDSAEGVLAGSKGQRQLQDRTSSGSYCRRARSREKLDSERPALRAASPQSLKSATSSRLQQGELAQAGSRGGAAADGGGQTLAPPPLPRRSRRRTADMAARRAASAADDMVEDDGGVLRETMREDGTPAEHSYDEIMREMQDDDVFDVESRRPPPEGDAPLPRDVGVGEADGGDDASPAWSGVQRRSIWSATASVASDAGGEARRDDDRGGDELARPPDDEEDAPASDAGGGDDVEGAAASVPPSDRPAGRRDDAAAGGGDAFATGVELQAALVAAVQAAEAARDVDSAQLALATAQSMAEQSNTMAAALSTIAAAAESGKKKKGKGKSKRRSSALFKSPARRYGRGVPLPGSDGAAAAAGGAGDGGGGGGSSGDDDDGEEPSDSDSDDEDRITRRAYMREVAKDSVSSTLKVKVKAMPATFAGISEWLADEARSHLRKVDKMQNSMRGSALALEQVHDLLAYRRMRVYQEQRKRVFETHKTKPHNRRVIAMLEREKETYIQELDGEQGAYDLMCKLWRAIREEALPVPEAVYEMKHRMLVYRRPRGTSYDDAVAEFVRRKNDYEDCRVTLSEEDRAIFARQDEDYFSLLLLAINHAPFNRYLARECSPKVTTFEGLCDCANHPESLRAWTGEGTRCIKNKAGDYNLPTVGSSRVRDDTSYAAALKAKPAAQSSAAGGAGGAAAGDATETPPPDVAEEPGEAGITMVMLNQLTAAQLKARYKPEAVKHHSVELLRRRENRHAKDQCLSCGSTDHTTRAHVCSSCAWCGLVDPPAGHLWSSCPKRLRTVSGSSESDSFPGWLLPAQALAGSDSGEHPSTWSDPRRDADRSRRGGGRGRGRGRGRGGGPGRGGGRGGRVGGLDRSVLQSALSSVLSPLTVTVPAAATTSVGAVSTAGTPSVPDAHQHIDPTGTIELDLGQHGDTPALAFVDNGAKSNAISVSFFRWLLQHPVLRDDVNAYKGSIRVLGVNDQPGGGAAVDDHVELRFLLPEDVVDPVTGQRIGVTAMFIVHDAPGYGDANAPILLGQPFLGARFWGGQKPTRVQDSNNPGSERFGARCQLVTVADDRDFTLPLFWSYMQSAAPTLVPLTLNGVDHKLDESAACVMARPRGNDAQLAARDPLARTGGPHVGASGEVPRRRPRVRFALPVPPTSPTVRRSLPTEALDATVPSMSVTPVRVNKVVVPLSIVAADADAAPVSADTAHVCRLSSLESGDATEEAEAAVVHDVGAPIFDFDDGDGGDDAGADDITAFQAVLPIFLEEVRRVDNAQQCAFVAQQPSPSDDDTDGAGERASGGDGDPGEPTAVSMMDAVESTIAALEAAERDDAAFAELGDVREAIELNPREGKQFLAQFTHAPILKAMSQISALDAFVQAHTNGRISASHSFSFSAESSSDFPAESSGSGCQTRQRARLSSSRISAECRVDEDSRPKTSGGSHLCGTDPHVPTTSPCPDLSVDTSTRHDDEEARVLSGFSSLKAGAETDAEATVDVAAAETPADERAESALWSTLTTAEDTDRVESFVRVPGADVRRPHTFRIGDAALPVERVDAFVSYLFADPSRVATEIAAVDKPLAKRARLSALCSALLATDVEVEERDERINSDALKILADVMLGEGEELGRVVMPDIVKDMARLLQAATRWRHTQKRIRGKEGEWLDKLIERLLRAGVLRESTSPVNNRLMLALKRNPDGTVKGLRLTLDLRDCNRRTILLHWDLPRSEEVFEILRDAKYMWRIDQPDGFWQIVADPKWTWVTAFTQNTDTVTRRLEFTRVVMGHQNSTHVYQRAMQRAFHSLLSERRAGLMLDDLFGGVKTEAELMDVVREIRRCCKRVGLKLKPEKCSFGLRRMRVLGFIIDEEGAHPDPAKVGVVMGIPPPSDVKLLASFLGFTDFYRRNIPDYHNRMWPLTKLKRAKVKWEWGPEQRDAFRWIKRQLASDAVVRIFDPARRVVIHSDGSPTGVGGVMSQIDATDGRPYLVFAWGRVLADAETRYPQAQVEVLALRDCLRKWSSYLAQEFTACIDARNLRCLWTRSFDETSSAGARRVQSWIMEFQDYAQLMVLVHVPSGKQIADLPSRAAEFRGERSPDWVPLKFPFKIVDQPDLVKQVFRFRVPSSAARSTGEAGAAVGAAGATTPSISQVSKSSERTTSASPAATVADDPLVVFKYKGCSKCRHAPFGCRRCNPRWSEYRDAKKASAAAKAAAEKSPRSKAAAPVATSRKPKAKPGSGKRVGDTDVESPPATPLFSVPSDEELRAGQLRALKACFTAIREHGDDAVMPGAKAVPITLHARARGSPKLLSARVGSVLVPVIPPDMREPFVQLAHSIPSAGHGGWQNTLHRLRAFAFWPGMTGDVQEFVKRCRGCQRQRGNDVRHRTPVRRRELEAPFLHVQMDVWGMLEPAEDGERYVLSLVDTFSGLVKLVSLHTKSSQAVARAFVDEWVSMFGTPVVVQTDLGSEFVNRVFRCTADLLWVSHSRGISHHARSQGGVERMHRVLGTTLRILCERHHGLWASLLNQVAFAMNTTVNRRVGATPFRAVFGFDPRIVFQAVREEPRDETRALRPEDFGRQVAARFAVARRALVAAQRRHLSRAELQDREAGARLASFAVGDLVWVRNPNEASPARNLGPMRVVGDRSVLGRADMFVVRNPKTGRRSDVHVSNMRPFLRQLEFGDLYHSNRDLESQWSSFCMFCGDGGELLKCGSCSNVAHAGCAGVTAAEIGDEQEWTCPTCVGGTTDAEADDDADYRDDGSTDAKYVRRMTAATIESLSAWTPWSSSEFDACAPCRITGGNAAPLAETPSVSMEAVW